MSLYCPPVPPRELREPMSKPVHIVILAAGEGTRMKSSLPKMLQTVGGRPMLMHLLDTAISMQPEHLNRKKLLFLQKQWENF